MPSLLGNARPLAGFGMNLASPQAVGLVGWFPFEDLTYRDSTNKSGWPTPTGNPTVVAHPVVGPALALQGNTQGLEIPAGHSFPTGSAARTIALWVYASSLANYLFLLDYGLVLSAQRCVPLILGTASPYIGVQGGLAYEINGATAYTTGVAVSAGAWTHLAFVQAGTDLASVSFYVNGIVQASAVNVGGTLNTSTGTGVRIGSTYQDANFYFDGFMADLRVYAYGLSAAQVWNLWAPQTRWELYQEVAQGTVLPSFLHDVGGPLPHPSPQLRRAPGLLSSA